MATRLATASVGGAVAAIANSKAKAIEHGQNIFVYTNIRTNQTVYSLTRSLRNKLAIEQLTYVGKQTVPSHVRKDLWRPLCVLSFPSPLQGLHAFAKLREFRALHETAYDSATVTQTEGPHAGKQLLPKKNKAKILMDQKANSVADMAAVLFMQDVPPTDNEVKHARWLHNRPVVDLRRGRGVAPDRPKKGKGSKETLGKIEWQGNVKGVKINWANILDAEFAETWPGDVLHGELHTSRYTAVWPPTKEADTDLQSRLGQAVKQ